MRLSEEAKRERAEAKRAERVAKLDGRSGFLRVWKLLTAARKPMVGHNCTYDLMFLYSHFEARRPDPSP